MYLTFLPWHSRLPDPIKSPPEVHLTQMLHCTTKGSAKRKRSIGYDTTNTNQTTSKLRRTTPSESESLTDNDHKLHKLNC